LIIEYDISNIQEKLILNILIASIFTLPTKESRSSLLTGKLQIQKVQPRALLPMQWLESHSTLSMATFSRPAQASPTSSSQIEINKKEKLAAWIFLEKVPVNI